jgi:FkbM family methyltransferase
MNSVSRKMGLQVIPERRMEKYFFVKRVQRIISEYQVDCIVDVGANQGQYRDFLRDEVHYDGLIISFEPDPDCFAVLSTRQEMDDKWVILNYALGQEVKKLDFNIMKSSVFNSFLEPDSSETQLFSTSNSILKTIKIEAKRLDEMIVKLKADHQFNNIYLKIDTQGFDLEVFEGASGCLDQIRAVQTEVSVLPIYKHMPSFDSSLKLFRSKGFEVSALYSLGEDRFPHAVEFDCIYLPKPE